MLEARRGERLVGSIFKGRVVRVLPGMQSAFVEVGLRRTAFLYAGDLNDPPETQTEKAQAGGTDRELSQGPVPISERLTEGQELIVQVAKEPIGTKGARVTSQITLPGRHMVFMPTVDHIGISRRITDTDERERLRGIAEKICPERSGVIVRTAGEGFAEEALQEDLSFLQALWQDILDRARSAKPPTELHRELDAALMAIRDRLQPDYKGVIVDSPDEYDRLHNFLERFLPECLPLLKLDQSSPPLFTRHGTEHDISRALGRKVWLKSGGYIVIEHTEALTTIDVNTGRYVGKSNFEDTILKVNLEAVREICFQLRLRNLGGIIVIDFIDMAELGSRKQVEDALTAALTADYVRTRVLPMSQLGLIEMTRKRVRPSLTQMMAASCKHCDGRGWTLSPGEVARQVVSKIRDTLASRREPESVRLVAHPAVVEILYDDYGDQLSEIQRNHGVRLEVDPKESIEVEHYEVKAE